MKYRFFDSCFAAQIYYFPLLIYTQNIGLIGLIHRLIVLCLLINKGVQSAIQDFSDPCRLENDEAENLKPDSLAFLSSVAQLIASIPDKARPKSTNALSSQYP